jgi:hypothetical protein
LGRRTIYGYSLSIKFPHEEAELKKELIMNRANDDGTKNKKGGNAPTKR